MSAEEAAALTRGTGGAVAPRARWAAALVFLGVAGALVGGLASRYVARERYVYFWDSANYWLWFIEFGPALQTAPRAAVGQLISSVRHSDYNLLPILPLATFSWFFGTSRLAYILAIVTTSVLPGAIALGAVVSQIQSRLGPGWAVGSFLISFTSALLLHPLWVPVLRGLPDAIGLPVIGAVLLLYFRREIGEHGVGRLVTIGVLLCLLVLLRRWYAFWVVSFFVAGAAVSLATAIGSGRVGLSAHLAIVRNMALIGVVFVASLFLAATPFAVRAISTNYSDAYSAYRFSTSASEVFGRLVSYFGWALLVWASAGLLWLVKDGRTRQWGCFLVLQNAIIVFMFSRTQDFDVQHYYLVLPAIAVGLSSLAALSWSTVANRVLRFLLVLPAMVIPLVSSAAVFDPGAARFAERVGFLPQVRYYPLVRQDVDVIRRILDRLEELQSKRPGDIYVLASSVVLNSSHLRVACRTWGKSRAFCDRILNSHDVDKRDGFPSAFRDAEYVVLGEPTQYHLRPEDQRVIGLVARDVRKGRGVGASFVQLSDRFELDNGVQALLYEKRVPIDSVALEALRAELAEAYPNSPLFSRQ